MAISIIKQPQKYTPSDNPSIWQVTSDNSNIVFFRTTIKEAVTSSTIAVNDFYTTPVYPTGSYFNLSMILDNYVKPELNTDLNVLAVPLTTPILNYTLQIQEKVYNSGITLIQDGTTTNTATATTFNAALDRVKFNGYQYANYVITTTGSPVNWLTNKPNVSKVNDSSTEHLHFLNDGVSGLKVQVKTYGSANNLLNTYTSTLTGSGNNQIYRVQASPKGLIASLGVSFDLVAYYTVQVLNSSNSPKTALRKYVYVPLECYLEPVNVLFENMFGVFDCYQFVNPQESINLTRTALQKNIYKLDNNGFYSDMNGNLYNASEENISVKSSSTHKVTSRELTDAESYWLKEVFQAKRAYIELADGTFAPISITNTSFAIPRNKWIRGAANNISLDYKLTDGI